MSIVICYRCNRRIDLDEDCEVCTKNEILGLDVPDGEFVCFDCLTDEEADRLMEGN